MWDEGHWNLRGRSPDASYDVR
ncbi:hypothetical protein LI221_13695 [Faecalimonas umbilicata]|nr:hypothetical protein [Faecalimonas umbilicata]